MTAIADSDRIDCLRLYRNVYAINMILCGWDGLGCPFYYNSSIEMV